MVLTIVLGNRVSVFSIALVAKTVTVTTNRAPAVNPCITNGESGTDIDSNSRQLVASYRMIDVSTENLLTSAEQVTPSDVLDRTLRNARTVKDIMMTMSPAVIGLPLLRGRCVADASTALPFRPLAFGRGWTCGGRVVIVGLGWLLLWSLVPGAASY